MNISDVTKCSNCGACYNACPKQAIAVAKDGRFYMPRVDTSKCIDCSLCVKVCPVNNKTEAQQPIYAVGCWHKKDKIVISSSSGGAFFGFAEKILLEGGVVFGAAYSDDCYSVVFESTDKVNISVLQKSKYVESLVGDSFRKIKNELEKGRKVLFCGTPCQVAGLKSYLKNDSELLITCDFACGGLASHKVYKEYIQSLEKRYGACVSNVDFRPKTHGWRRYAVLIDFKNGKHYNRLGVEDEYLRSFLYGGYTVRDYCHECKFSNAHLSDITLADFWLHKKFSKLGNDNGISLVLCNSSKGKAMLEGIMDKYVFEELDINEATYNNKPVVISEEKKQKYKKFWEIYEKKGLCAACNALSPQSVNVKVKNRLMRYLKKIRNRK